MLGAAGWLSQREQYTRWLAYVLLSHAQAHNSQPQAHNLKHLLLTCTAVLLSCLPASTALVIPSQLFPAGAHGQHEGGCCRPHVPAQHSGVHAVDDRFWLHVSVPERLWFGGVLIFCGVCTAARPGCRAGMHEYLTGNFACQATCSPSMRNTTHCAQFPALQ